MTGTRMPQGRPAAEIVLCVSASSGLIAIPLGEKYPYGHTALRATGTFERQKVGTHILRDLGSVPDVMRDLIRTAGRLHVTLTTSSRPYLGDYADELARRLPGTWKTSFEVYAHPVWQEDWIPLLWDNGALAEAMEHHRVPYGAVLTSTTGAELLLIERPGATGGYLLGACASSTFDDNYQDRFAPASIALPAYPQRAASLVTSEFLPAYERAVHERLLSEVELDHRELVARRGSLDTGSGPGPASGPGVDASTVVLRRLRPRAAHLLYRTRKSVAVPSPENAALERLAEFLSPRRDLLDQPTSVFSQPSPLPPTSAEDVRRWLADAPTLLKHARAALPPAPRSSRSKILALASPAQPASLPPGRRH